PYRDYIALLRRQDLSEAEVFWRRMLKGFTTPTPVGSNAPPAGLSHPTAHDSRQVRLPASITAALQSLAMQHRLTMNTLVQGAWALLLSRYSREEDVIFGATVSGRPADLSGVESMVGIFINTLPLRVQIAPDEMLLPWLKRLQGRMVELRQYEHSPLIQVQGWSEAPRGMPLFESILVFENIPIDPPLEDFAGALEIRAIQTNGGGTNYPLTVVAFPGREFLLRIIYDCSRFGASEATRILGDFETLLRGIVANPERRLSELPILGAAEKQQVPIEWKTTNVDRRVPSTQYQTRPEPETPFAPSSTLAEKIADIWAQVLKVNRIRIDDNFFELGGHSLLATRVISRLRDAFRVELPLRSLFESPTAAGLAERIETLLWAGEKPAGGSESEEREEMKL
ncbi:MAG: condensation domain-containing protein, partial [Candidatus Binatia bacterium]